VNERRVRVSSLRTLSPRPNHSPLIFHILQYKLYCLLLVVCFLAVDACVFARRRCVSTLGNELYVGTIIHTVHTAASTYNTKVRFPNCIVQKTAYNSIQPSMTKSVSDSYIMSTSPGLALWYTLYGWLG
jgi:hypothetical protein